MDITINDARVDREHAEILQLLESFALVGSRDHGAVRQLMVDLKDHVVIHFIDEEFLFEKRYTMPADYVAMHKAEHARLRELVLSTTRSVRLDDLESVRAAIDTVRREIERHIAEVDVAMNAYIDPRARGTGD